MNRTLLLLTFILFSFTLFSQNVFERHIYLADSLHYNSFKSFQKNNGSYVSAASFGRPGNSIYEMHILSMDSTGFATDYLQIVPHQTSNAYACDPLAGGGQIAVTARRPNDSFLGIFDSTGTLLSGFGYTFPTPFFSPHSITHTPNSHYLIAGAHNLTGTVLETDLNGNLISAHEYAINNYQSELDFALPLKNKNRLYHGTYYFPVSAGFTAQPTLLLTDSMGGLIWSLQAGDTAATFYPGSAIELSDSSIIVCGSYVDIMPVLTHSYVYKISQTGQIIWSLKIDPPFNFVLLDAAAESDSIIVLSGLSGNSGSRAKMTFCKMDTSGNVINTIAYTDFDRSILAYSVIHCDDGGYLGAGTAYLDSGRTAFNFIKTDNNFGAFCYDTILSVQTSPFSVYDSSNCIISSLVVASASLSASDFTVSHPGPLQFNRCIVNEIRRNDYFISNVSGFFDGYGLYLHFYSHELVKINLHVSDLAGREMLAQPISAFNGINKIELSASNFAPGVYMVTLRGQGGVAGCKVMKY